MKLIDVLIWVFAHHYIFVFLAVGCYIVWRKLSQKRKLKSHRIFAKKSLITLKIDNYDFYEYHKNIIYKQLLHIKKNSMYDSMKKMLNEYDNWSVKMNRDEFILYVVNEIQNSVDNETKEIENFLYLNYYDYGKKRIINVLIKKGYFINRAKIMSDFYKMIEAIAKNTTNKTNVKRMIAILDLIETVLIQNFETFKDTMIQINGEIEKICEDVLKHTNENENEIFYNSKR